MPNGRLIAPNLDDRTWQDIVDEARLLIPKYAPEWTDHNPSDPGITLIELFAWLVEGMIYRLNRVPEKNFIEFLNLMGITRDPATPALADVTFKVTKKVAIKKGTQISTTHTEVAEAIVFETDDVLNAIPINLMNCISVIPNFSPGGLTYTYQNHSNSLVVGPLKGIELSIGAIKTTLLYLGFDKRIIEPIDIHFQIKQGTISGSNDAGFMYYKNNTWSPIQKIIADSTDSFCKSGNVVVQVPSDWQISKLAEWKIQELYPVTPDDEIKDSRYWLAIEIPNNSNSPIKVVLERIAINTVSATNALTVNIQSDDAQAELLGTSNGLPFQIFTLQNSPLYKQPKVKDSYQHLKIQVKEPNGSGNFETWEQKDDLPEGEGKHYRLNPVTGEIMFGNYDANTQKGNGKIPPRTSEIRALSYRYVIGGTKSNVPALTINILRSAIDGFENVTNPGAATGGSDQEAIEDTKRRGPDALKNRFRAVTLEDYEYLAQEASTDVKKVRALPPKLQKDGSSWTYGNLTREPGNVNVIILPDAPLTELAPMPSDDLLEEVLAYLDERRVITTRLTVTKPRYLPITATVNVTLWNNAINTGLVNENDFVTEMKKKITDYLHPVSGGTDKNGWEVGQDITIPGLFEYIKPTSEVGFISDLTIKAQTPLYPNGRPPDLLQSGVWIQLADYEIVCSHTDHAIPIKKQ